MNLLPDRLLCHLVGQRLVNGAVEKANKCLPLGSVIFAVPYLLGGLIRQHQRIVYILIDFLVFPPFVKFCPSIAIGQNCVSVTIFFTAGAFKVFVSIFVRKLITELLVP